MGANHKVRFTVPTAPTPPPPPSSSLRGAAFPLKKLASEAAVIVPAELDADGVTLRCVTPDLSDLVCDGSVLVEACVCETASDMQWTHDELELELISTVDVARLRLAGKSSEKALAAVAGAPCVSRLVTFDGRGRRRTSGAVESYSAALRQPGELPVPEKGEEGGGAAAATWVTQEAACRDLGNGSHDAKIVCERAGSFVLCVLLEGNIVLERPTGAGADRRAVVRAPDHRADGARQPGASRRRGARVLGGAARSVRQRERRRADGGGEDI